MAYRQPAERRDRSSSDNMTTTSYLEHCLEQVNNLPQRTQDALEQIRMLDDKVNTLMGDSQNAANSTVSRATAKGMPTENARRSYQEMINLQRSASEAAEKKISIAELLNENVATIYADVERRLNEFEALLKKDGRWPTPNNNSILATPTTVAPPTGSTTATSVPTPPEKMANAESVEVEEKNTDLAGTGAGAGTGTGTGIGIAAKNPIVSTSDDDADINMDDNDSVSRMDDADDVDFDPDGKLSDAADTADGADNQLYCFCRNVSHGEMIACEATDCPYEWFHFECVGLKESPKGQWYCDECLAQMRKKGTGGRRNKNISLAA